MEDAFKWTERARGYVTELESETRSDKFVIKSLEAEVERLNKVVKVLAKDAYLACYRVRVGSPQEALARAELEATQQAEGE